MSKRADTAEEIAIAADKCVQFYLQNPGLAGTDAIIDLYRAVMRLAEEIVDLKKS